MQSTLQQTNKPFQFLSSVGGRNISLQDTTVEADEVRTAVRKPTEATQVRPQTVSTISRINFTTMIAEMKG